MQKILLPLFITLFLGCQDTADYIFGSDDTNTSSDITTGSQNDTQAQDDTQTKPLETNPTIIIKPTAVIKVNALRAQAPFTFNLDAASSFIDPSLTLLSYTWSSSDGKNISSIINPSIYYENAGEYTITLKVEDSHHQISTVTQKLFLSAPETVMIEPVSPTAQLSVNALEGYAPFTLLLNASESLKDPEASIERYEWSVSSITESKEGIETSFVLENVGTYSVRLKVTDSNAKSDTKVIQIKVLPAPEVETPDANTTENETNTTQPLLPDLDPLEIALTHSALSGEVPFSVDFTAQISGGDEQYNYYWLSGDGEVNNQAMSTQSYTYDKPGTYTMIFSAKDGTGLVASVSKTVVVNKKEVVNDPLSFTLTNSTQSGEAPLDIDFNVQALGGDGNYTYVWSSGDGVDGYTTQASSLSYTYQNAGTFLLRLEVRDGAGNSKIETRTVSIQAKPDDTNITRLSFKVGSAKYYPQNDPLDGSSNSALDPTKLVYSDDLKSYYIAYDDGGIRDWNLNIGDSAYTQIFIPPGVSSVGISFNDASLASQSIELSDFGEYDKDYVQANNFDYNAHTWYYKGAQSRTYMHEREAQRLNTSSTLIIAFHDKDNLYANANLGQYSFSYYIKPEDQEIFKAWAGDTNSSLAQSYPDDGSNKNFINGSSFPTEQQKKLLFTNASITEANYIYYVASSAPDQLSWSLSKGQSGYIRLYMSPGITKVNMSINSQSLAASQSIYFKDLGEASCNAPLPHAPDYENSPANWRIFTGAHTYSHTRESNNTKLESCVLYSFYDYDNLNSSIFLQDVQFTYVANERAVYDDWVAPKLYFDPINGNNNNDGSSSSPKASLSSALASGQSFEDYTQVILRAGNHGAINLNALSPEHSITFKAFKDEKAVFSQLDISNSSKLFFKDITIDGSLSNLGRDNFMLNADASSSALSFDHMTIKSADDSSTWLKADWYANAIGGMRLQGDDMNVTNSFITNVYHAVMLDGDRAYYAHNIIDNFAGDGIRGLGDGSTYEYNTVRDCYIDDYAIQHDDAFQAFRTDADANYKIKDVTIRGNKFLLFEDPITQFVLDNHLIGTLMQGLIITDGHADTWTVEDNLIVNAQYHGISLYGAINSLVQNNIVISHPDLPKETAPRIFIDDQKKSGQEHNNSNNIIRDNITTTLTTWTFDDTSVVENNIDIDESNIMNFDVLFVDYEGHDYTLK